MSYFKAKKDLELVLSFKASVHNFWTIEDEAKRNVRQRAHMFDIETPTQQRRAIREESARPPGGGARLALRRFPQR